jgi:hypothetical protein
VLLGSKSIAKSGVEARAQIKATRESLQAALELQEADIPEISQAIARLERVEAELERMEAGIAVREGAGLTGDGSRAGLPGVNPPTSSR